MLADYTAIPTLAVSDLERAKAFYSGTLGFTGEEQTEGILYKAGDSTILVYPSSFAGTNKATAATFGVPADAFDAEVATLRDKGIEFLTFDYPGIVWEDGVATMDTERSVWFTDPDGNILAVGTTGA